MPTLPNPRHEAFAQARAKGASLADAYEDAGFTPDRSHACRLANNTNVADRLAELRAEQIEFDDARPLAVIAALMRVAKAAETEATPAAHKEVRLTLLEVDRLRGEMLLSRARDRDLIDYDTRYNA